MLEAMLKITSNTDHYKIRKLATLPVGKTLLHRVVLLKTACNTYG
jgi:hypothetical protein